MRSGQRTHLSGAGVEAAHPHLPSLLPLPPLCERCCMQQYHCACGMVSPSTSAIDMMSGAHARFNAWICMHGARTPLLHKQVPVYHAPIFTPTPLPHFNSLQVNSYALNSIGPHVELVGGHARFGVVYGVAAFTGTLASFVFTPSPSLGSSGACAASAHRPVHSLWQLRIGSWPMLYVVQGHCCVGCRGLGQWPRLGTQHVRSSGSNGTTPAA
jgi:hypothetical protein